MAAKQKTMVQHVGDAARWLVIANFVLIITAELMKHPELLDPKTQLALSIANLAAVALVKYLDPNTPNK